MVDALSMSEFLRRLPALSHVEASVLERLSETASPRFFADGAHVFRKGDPSSCVYALLRGGIRLERSLPVGDVTLGRFIQGELFGDGDYILGAERYADAVTDTEVCLLQLDGQRLSGLAGTDPALESALYWAFWRSLSRRLRAANARLAAFFPGNGDSPTAELPPLALESPNSFRVSLTEKRALFSEQQLSPLEINLLSTMSRERKMESGEVLFREGDPGEHLYVVLEGEMIITKEIAGAEEALDFLARGDIFGEMALIDDQPRSAGAKAGDRGAVIVAISAEIMSEVLDIQRVSSLRLLKLLCARVAHRVRGSHDKLLGWQMLAGVPM